jgi:anti-sigma B factor antagonist
MNTSVSTFQQAKVVTIAGEIDGSNAPQAQEVILAQAEPGARVVLDMTGVTYMSSAGLRMLLTAYRTISGKAGKIVLVGLSSDLEDTMSATGFLDFFTHCDTLEAGAAAVA